jgi:hypothetical protein
MTEVDTWLFAIRDRPAETLGRLLGFDDLFDLHDRWIHDCWDTPGGHGLMAFRGSYKTSSVITTGIIRYLLFNPLARIGLFRKTHTDAAAVIKAVSSAFDKPEIQALFKLVHGMPPQKTEDSTGRLNLSFKTNRAPEPSLSGFGIDTAITGTHLDVVLLDDFITLEDRVSSAEREKTREHIKEITANIVNPGGLTIFLGTPWAADDAWQDIKKFTEVKKYPLSKYNFLSPEDIEEKRRRLNPLLFAINYELELITDDSLMFKEPRWGKMDPESWRNHRVIGQIDAAYTSDGDTCALTIKAGNSVIGWVRQGSVMGWYDFIGTQYKKWRCSEIMLETNADKGFLARELEYRGMTTHTYNEAMNKEIKISTYLYDAWPSLVWDPDTDPEYMVQILDWRPDGKGHDDAPDSAAVICRATRGSVPMDETSDLQDWLWGRSG